MRNTSVRLEYRSCYTKRDWSFVKLMKVQKSISRTGEEKTISILRFFKVSKPKTLAKQISSIQKPKARRRRRAYCKKGAKLEDLVVADYASFIFARYTLRGKGLSIALSCPYDLPRVSAIPRAGAMRQGAYLIYREHCIWLNTKGSSSSRGRKSTSEEFQVKSARTRISQA